MLDSQSADRSVSQQIRTQSVWLRTHSARYRRKSDSHRREWCRIGQYRGTWQECPFKAYRPHAAFQVERMSLFSNTPAMAFSNLVSRYFTMEITMKHLAFACLFLFSCACQAADTIDQAGWLAGHWQEVKGKSDVEEHWMAPKGATMLAVNRTTRSGSATEFEFLRIIERDGTLVYVASPAGRPPTEFAAITIAPGKLVFENKAHGFPARVMYTQESADVVVARIEGQIGGKDRSMEWRFARSK
jgi:hypothetical protein